MATFHQNLVQSFLNFKNKYLRQYDTYEDAVDDIDNIPEGGIFYTNDNLSVQDIIDGMTALHLAGSQIGAGTKNFTFNTEAQKRMLVITKKSGVIVESKEIPVDVLRTGDVIPLGNAAPIVAAEYKGPNPMTQSVQIPEGAKIGVLYSYTGGGNGTYFYDEETKALMNTNETGIGLATDLSKATGASVTYNGNDSFTITVTDSALSVYVYIDMLVLGGSASGRNVSFDAAGTNLESTDVEGAIKEVNEDLTDNNKSFKFGYDSVNNKYGYYKQEGGADTFVPFSAGVNVCLTYRLNANLLCVEDGVINTIDNVGSGATAVTNIVNNCNLFSSGAMDTAYTATFTIAKSGYYAVSNYTQYTPFTYYSVGQTISLYVSSTAVTCPTVMYMETLPN